MDVQADVTFGVFTLQVKELSDDQVCDLIVDGSAEEHDSLLEQKREDIEGALRARSRFDDGGNDVMHQWPEVRCRVAG